MFQSVFAPAPYNTRFKRDSKMVPFNPCAVSDDWNDNPKSKKGRKSHLQQFTEKAPRDYELVLNDPELPRLVHEHLKHVFKCGGDSHRKRMKELHDFFQRAKGDYYISTETTAHSIAPVHMLKCNGQPTHRAWA
jgi:hypothetical protein